MDTPHSMTEAQISKIGDTPERHSQLIISASRDNQALFVGVHSLEERQFAVSTRRPLDREEAPAEQEHEASRSKDL